MTREELERWANSPEPEDGQELLSATVLKASSFARHALRLWDERDNWKFVAEEAQVRQDKAEDDLAAWEKYGREAGWHLKNVVDCIMDSETFPRGLTAHSMSEITAFLSQPPPLTSTPSPETKEGK